MRSISNWSTTVLSKLADTRLRSVILISYGTNGTYRLADTTLDALFGIDHIGFGTGINRPQRAFAETAATGHAFADDLKFHGESPPYFRYCAIFIPAMRPDVVE